MPDQTQKFPPLPPYRVLQQPHGRSRAHRDDAGARYRRARRGAGATEETAAAAHEEAGRVRSRPRGSRAPPSAPSRAMDACTSSCRRWPRSRITSSWSPPSRPPRASQKLPVVLEGYEPPRDPRLQHAAGHARSGRHRSEHPPGGQLGTSWPSRRSSCTRPRTRRGCRSEKFAHGRQAPGHRRRQPLRARRRHAGRFAVPAPAGRAGQHDRLLAQPSLAVLSVLRPVHRAHQPGAARGRSAQRFGVRAGDRDEGTAGACRALGVLEGRALAWWIARCAIC